MYHLKNQTRNGVSALQIYTVLPRRRITVVYIQQAGFKLMKSTRERAMFRTLN
jgi:hypothetical protein